MAPKDLADLHYIAWDDRAKGFDSIMLQSAVNYVLSKLCNTDILIYGTLSFA